MGKDAVAKILQIKPEAIVEILLRGIVAHQYCSLINLADGDKELSEAKALDSHCILVPPGLDRKL